MGMSAKKVSVCVVLLFLLVSIPILSAQSISSKDPYPPYPIGWKVKIGVL